MPTTHSSGVPNLVISESTSSIRFSVASTFLESMTSPSPSSTQTQWNAFPTSNPTQYTAFASLPDVLQLPRLRISSSVSALRSDFLADPDQRCSGISADGPGGDALVATPVLAMATRVEPSPAVGTPPHTTRRAHRQGKTRVRVICRCEYHERMVAGDTLRIGLTPHLPRPACL